MPSCAISPFVSASIGAEHGHGAAVRSARGRTRSSVGEAADRVRGRRRRCGSRTPRRITVSALSDRGRSQSASSSPSIDPACATPARGPAARWNAGSTHTSLGRPAGSRSSWSASRAGRVAEQDRRRRPDLPTASSVSASVAVSITSTPCWRSTSASGHRAVRRRVVGGERHADGRAARSASAMSRIAMSSTTMPRTIQNATRRAAARSVGVEATSCARSSWLRSSVRSSTTVTRGDGSIGVRSRAGGAQARARAATIARTARGCPCRRGSARRRSRAAAAASASASAGNSAPPRRANSRAVVPGKRDQHLALGEVRARSSGTARRSRSPSRRPPRRAPHVRAAAPRRAGRPRRTARRSPRCAGSGAAGRRPGTPTTTAADHQQRSRPAMPSAGGPCDRRRSGTPTSQSRICVDDLVEEGRLGRLVLRLGQLVDQPVLRPPAGRDRPGRRTSSSDQGHQDPARWPRHGCSPVRGR